MTSRLDGSVALVTGGTRGIGKGVVHELAEAGAIVYATGRSGIGESPSSCPAEPGRPRTIGCDHRVDDDVASVLRGIAAAHGRLDVLVNSVFDAAVFEQSIGTPFWELPVRAWDDIVGVGTRSAYVAAVHAVPLMLDAGGGLIVNVSSAGAERYFYNVAYGAGKAALDKLSRDMAEELGPHAVTVISLWPNVTRTEHIDAVIAGGDEDAIARLGRLDRLETPRFHGRAVVALASDSTNSELSGQRVWTAQLAERFGFDDELGNSHRAPRW